MSEENAGGQIRAGSLIFVALFVVLSVFLLSQLGAETKFSAKGKLFAQPRFWPAVGVAMMVGFGLLHLGMNWRERAGWASGEVVYWLRALEYLAWFMVYVWAVPIIGYLAATLILMVLLAFRQGYRGGRQLLTAAMVGFVIVLVFKTGLSVKIPGGAVYEYLPDGLRNFMIVNF